MTSRDNPPGTTQPVANRQKTNRRMLMLLFGVGAVPVLLAFFMYFSGSFIPQGRTNKGTLILPPLALGSWKLQATERGTAGGEVATESNAQEKPKWRLVVVGEGACDNRCEEALFTTRQVNVALGREADRVERYYLHVGAVHGGATRDENLLATVTAKFPKLHLAEIDRFALLGTLEEIMDAEAALSDNFVFVIDPNDNIMMYYTTEQSGNDMLKDLKQLLKLSNIG